MRCRVGIYGGWVCALVLAFSLAGNTVLGAGPAKPQPAIPAPSGAAVQQSPNHFADDDIHGRGRIDSMGRNAFIIDDRYLPLSASAVYRTRSGAPASPYQFRVGSRVAYRLNLRNEIAALFLLER